MKIWKISQNDNTGYDTYDSAVVAAESEQEARKIHPAGWNCCPENWAQESQIKVELIGLAEPTVKPGVIVSSYNGS